MNPRQTTPPDKEPVALEELKTLLRIDDCDCDVELIDLIKIARTYIEEAYWLQLITAEWEWKLDQFEDVMYVPRSPLQEAEIEYVDPAGVTQTLDPSAYELDTAAMPGRIRLAYGQSWPATRCQPGSITLTLTNGFGDSREDVPPTIRRAVLMVAAHLYENRGGCAGDVPGVDFLMTAYRMTYARATVPA